MIDLFKDDMFIFKDYSFIFTDDLIIFKEELFILKIFYLFQFYRPRNVSLVHVPCSVQRHCE